MDILRESLIKDETYLEEIKLQNNNAQLILKQYDLKIQEEETKRIQEEEQTKRKQEEEQTKRKQEEEQTKRAQIELEKERIILDQINCKIALAKLTKST